MYIHRLTQLKNNSKILFYSAVLQFYTLLSKKKSEMCVQVQTASKPKNTCWKKWSLFFIYFALIPSEIRFDFYTLKHCSGKVFFWLSIFCTFTLLHNALKKYFLSEFFFNFYILHNVLQKYFLCLNLFLSFTLLRTAPKNCFFFGRTYSTLSRTTLWNNFKILIYSAVLHFYTMLLKSIFLT